MMEMEIGTLDFYNADFNFGTGDYTIEMWYYPIDDGLTVTLYDQRTSALTQNYLTNSPLMYIGSATDGTN